MDANGWRTDVENMPQGQVVEVTRVEEATVMIYGYVKEPDTGKMFIPTAWREPASG